MSPPLTNAIVDPSGEIPGSPNDGSGRRGLRRVSRAGHRNREDAHIFFIDNPKSTINPQSAIRNPQCYPISKVRPIRSETTR